MRGAAGTGNDDAQPAVGQTLAHRNHRVGVVVEEVQLIERDDYGPSFDRVAYTHRVVDALVAHGVELIAMAGFGTILEKPIHDAFPNRILNTHPALLPAFPGIGSVEQALAHGVKVFGVTVHFVDEGVDTGPIIAQRALELTGLPSPEEVRAALRPLVASDALSRTQSTRWCC